MVKSGRIKQSKQEYILDVFVYLVIISFCLTVIVPFWNLFVISVTPASAMSLKFQLIPKIIDFSAWMSILASDFMWRCFSNTVVRTSLGTLVALLLTVTFTYPLSVKTFPLRNTLLMLVTFTMFFGGGLIPSFLLVKNLGLMNSVWALVLPSSISAFNVIILKNFFNGIPASLVESAKIDGANDVLILFKIVLPLSLPILATLSLWNMVSHWNSWFDVMLYIEDRRKYVLQIVLREFITAAEAASADFPQTAGSAQAPSEGLRAACNLFVIIPIVMAYPFLQKYFITGITIGAVKE